MNNPTPKELAKACEAVAEWMGWTSLERDEDGVEHWRQGNTIRFADDLLTGNGMLELMEALQARQAERKQFYIKAVRESPEGATVKEPDGRRITCYADTAPAALVLATYRMMKDAADE